MLEINTEFYNGIMFIRLDGTLSKNEVGKFKNEVTNIIKENNIECNLFKQDSYVFINKDSDIKGYDDEMEFYRDNGIDCDYIDKLPINYPIKRGIVIKNSSYSFNPYKYLIKIKEILKNKKPIHNELALLSLLDLNQRPSD